MKFKVVSKIVSPLVCFVLIGSRAELLSRSFFEGEGERNRGVSSEGEGPAKGSGEGDLGRRARGTVGGTSGVSSMGLVRGKGRPKVLGTGLLCQRSGARGGESRASINLLMVWTTGIGTSCRFAVKVVSKRWVSR